MVRTRCGHPLRFYIRLHFAKCAPVATLKLRLVSPTAGAPCRVYKTSLMQSGLRWGRSRQSAAPPRSLCALAPSPVRPTGRPAPRHWSVRLRAVVAVSGLPAGHHVLAPPTLVPRRCAASARRGLPVRPQGAPSSPRCASRLFATKNIANNPMRTGARGLKRSQKLRCAK